MRPILKSASVVWLAASMWMVTAGDAAERPDPNRWQSAIENFAQADRESMPAQNGILFVGSSSIRLWDLRQSFPDLSTINRGFGGSHLADVTCYADRIVLPYEPRIVVLYAGDNDIASGLSPSQVTEDFQQFVAVVRRQLPSARIVFISIKPSLLRWAVYDRMKAANDAIKALSDNDEMLEFVDVARAMLGEDGRPRGELFAGDGLHLNVAGYRLWTELVRPLLAGQKSTASSPP